MFCVFFKLMSVDRANVAISGTRLYSDPARTIGYDNVTDRETSCDGIVDQGDVEKRKMISFLAPDRTKCGKTTSLHVEVQVPNSSSSAN